MPAICLAERAESIRRSTAVFIGNSCFRERSADGKEIHALKFKLKENGKVLAGEIIWILDLRDQAATWTLPKGKVFDLCECSRQSDSLVDCGRSRESKEAAEDVQ